ncbi:MAG: hypothetical protein KKC75_04530 [Nanoarchaeota archaeon]|nr:hypothetical protein [Nanoarchaeota archaeon]MBU1005316.1 hypothetical protein [Nanoarchaeota archaeon]MBU1945512.1 hypothetical protein [Nanoarchaeota archaeon]
MLFWKRKSKKEKPKKKPVKKVKKKVSAKKSPKKVQISKKQAKKEEKFVVGFEEVIVKCPNCGREFKIVKSSAFNTEGMLCQRCAAGGGLGFEDDSDF